MRPDYPLPPQQVLEAFRRGMVIPAHPLALTAQKKLDERRQRALSRYYLEAGAGGLAVGVHTTEFKIHEPKLGLLRPVLELAAETAGAWWKARGPTRGGPPMLIAGIVGPTGQAVREAVLARELGYHAGLLSLAALKEADDSQLVAHARAVAEAIPIMGFYLQPDVGGRLLCEGFWRGLAEIPNLVGIKIAPFNRYQTLVVVRAVAEAGRAGEVALYTGNDDSILLDLLTTYEFSGSGRTIRAGIVGGLLGHWAYWTRKAVEILEQARGAREGGSIPAGLLTLGAQVTEANEAVFDPANRFRGCIAGILYTLTRSGLLEAVRPLDEREVLSPGQAQRIDRVIRDYPHLHDHEFVRAHLESWLAP